jgi:AraC family transcriptional regulator
LHKEALDTLLFELIIEFSLLNKHISKQLKKIDAVKKSTREELYRRLFLAKEFIHDHVCENLTLEQIAKAACLDKFHFLYNFKALFNTTPHQYYTELKLQKAFQLLQSKQHSVTGVCYLVGFKGIGSFSNLFKRRFDISPSQLLK